ncbi:MAG: ribosome-associated translation inhibitor RaiA [Gammaproteobacteria bacterium]|nr:ribosome-associated translation inhibitor RaiA [Gammaproteobacteria bacterium]
MQLNITGHHLDLSPALNEYIKNKLQKVQRHFDHVVDAHIVLGIEKQLHKAEATVHVAGNTLHAASEHSDMYAAIDSMLDKLDRQVRRHKEKLTDHHARDAVNRDQV